MSIYTLDYYQRDQDEYWFQRHGLLRPDELAALCYAFSRPFTGGKAPRYAHFPPVMPGLVYSIGCGLGHLEATMERMGVTVIGVDPSPGPKEAYQGTTLIDRYDGGGDTIMFVESIEHIPLEEIRRIWTLIPQTARIIIVNWLDFFPIPVSANGEDHITRVDDALFDELSDGRIELVRRGSHLVLEGRR